MVLIYSVTAGTEEAENIGRVLLQNHACACVNIIPGMVSMYRWKGRIEHAREAVLLIKTEREKYAEVETLIRQNHSYEVPAIFMLDVEQVEPLFADWLKNQLK